MDQSMVAAQTFVLKTNISGCSRCEKEIKKLLQDIGGVHRISIDAAQEKIEISATIDPQTILKLLRKNGKKSGLEWEPVIEQKKIMKSPANHYHDKDLVSQLQKLSEIKGLKSIEVNKDGMKINFRENEQDFDRKSETSSARKAHGKAKHKKYDEGERVMNDDCDFRGNHEYFCSRNKAMNKQYCDGCGQPTNCRCNMASYGSVSTGIPWPGYFPSAPPEMVYYPPPVPSYQEMPYNHPFYSTFSDDNPRSCIIV